MTFNDHEGSTKSYAYTRENNVEVVQADFVPPAAAITDRVRAGTVRNVMLHDGSWVRLRKVADDYDPTDRDRAYTYIRERAEGRRDRHRPALHLARLERHARAEQHGRDPARAAPVRAAVPGQRRAREAAEASSDSQRLGGQRYHRRR